MSLQITTILDKVVSHAASSGYFAGVNTHEPKNAPGAPLAAVWVQSLGPVGRSGLSSTSGLLVLRVRVYASMVSDPQDAIDPQVLEAVDYLLGIYSANFTLGGNVRAVDLLGMTGTPLSAQAGYLGIDNKMYRVMDITLPLIINDLWGQVA